MDDPFADIRPDNADELTNETPPDVDTSPEPENDDAGPVEPVEGDDS